MKNNQIIFLFFISIVFSTGALSQNVFPASGRTGINTVNPAASLHVIGGARIGNTTNFVNIDSATGNLAFAGEAGYRVGGNKYAFQYNGNPNYGLFFNQTNVRYEFRNSAAAPTFYIGADNGTGYFAGNLGIGNTNPLAKLDISGNIKIADGTQGSGKVLISDADGMASWQTIPAGISGTGVAGNLTYWTSPNSVSGNSNLFWDNVNNKLGINTAAPTHSLTLGSTGNGLSVYNTPDQTTNYERFGLSWQSNILDIGTFYSGAGTQRQIRIGIQQSAGGTTLAGGRIMTITLNPSLTKGVFDFQVNTGGIGNIVSAGGIFSQNSGISRLMDLHPSYSQTSAAGYTVLRISPYEGSTGSSAKLLIDAGTNSEGNGGGIHTSKFSVDNSGNSYFAGNMGIGNTNPVAKLDVAGNIKITDGTQGAGKVLISDTDGLATWQTIPAGISGTGAAGNLTYWTATNSIGANSNLFWDNANNRLGVGNSTPIASLDLNGNIRIADGTQAAGKVLISDQNGFASWQTIPVSIAGSGAAGNVSIWTGTNSLGYNNNFFWDDANSRLGIGTLTPTTSLDVIGKIRFADGSQGTGKVLVSDVNGIGTWQTLPSGVAGSGIAGNIAIWSGTSSIGSNTSLFWDNINRRLGIGTATPAARLDILGNIKIADGTQGTGKVLISDANGLASWQTIPAGISGSGSAGNLTYWTAANSIGANNNLVWDDANNRLGVGNSTPIASLDLSGNIRIADGTQAAGKVLISDQNGFASWQTIPVSIAGSGAAGNVSIWTGTNSLGYNNNFFWDDANSRLGIGTLTPTTSLDVIGKIRLADGSQGTGKVLVSDVNGMGTWQTLPSGVAGSGIAGNIAIWSGTSSIGSNTSLLWDNINRRLGIGTATPAARLDILGNIKIADGTQGTGRVLTSDANGLASWQIPATGISGSGSNGYLTFWNSTNSLSANTNLYWDNINNRLGIGNNNPIVSLDLAGNIKIADGTQGNGKVLTSDATGVASWQNIPQSISGTGTTGNISFWSGTNSLGANTNLYWDNINNRLGIGNNNPSAAVDINGNIKIADGTQGAGKALISDANGVASWQTIGASSWAGSGNNIYSSNSGNVGIGTNNPSTKLHVKGYVILSDTSDNSSGNVMIGVTNNVVNSKLYIKSTQAFGIYVEAPTVSQYGLLVNGSAAKPGTSTWIVSSDERLKSYIKPYTEGLSQVMKINPVKFHYNAESGYDTKQEYVGVVAQQLEKVAPYMVGKFKRDSDKKEFLNVDNGAMTYMLINAVKELKADADIKETTIKDQQQQIDQLQKQMLAVMQKLNEVQAVQQQCCSVNPAEIPPLGNQSIILSEAASLEQNLPNPFKNKTIIKYHLPANTNNAQLIVTNNAGKTINTIKLSGKADGQVTLDAGILSPGTYYYSLIINGNKVDTKKMEILR